MIFRLTATPEELDSLSERDVGLLISRLAEAGREGRHFVLVERDICDWILENIHLATLHREYVSYVKSQMTFLGNLQSDAKALCDIRIGSDPPKRLSNGFFEIGHSTFMNGDFAVNATSLVCEGPDDLQFYSFLFSCISSCQGCPTFNYDGVVGGGNLIFSTFEQELEKRRISVAIYDQD